MRKPISLLSSALVLGLIAASAAQAQDRTVQLRLSHWVPPTHPMHAAAVAWAESIDKASNGTIKITIFPGQQLGRAFDHYNMARDGIADISHVNPGYEPGRFPIIGAVELPFVFSNAKEGSAALDAWYRRHVEREMKDVRYCLGFAHDPGTFHFARKKVTLPTEMSGLKVRPPNAVIANWMTLLGATNIQASAPEIRDVLEKGVADVAGSPWGSVLLFGIDKVTKYHIDAPLYVSEQLWVLNKAKYDSLSPAQRKVMDQHCSTDWALKVATPWAEFESAGREKIKALPGHELEPLSPDQLAAWRKSAEPVVGNWEASVRKANEDPKAIFEDLRKTVAEYKSGY
ncbi:MAG: TRAP transporter substrate-binding protein [Hyphomicrobiales bacterium]|nr:TRAP transporter substrate-binding protein [Hyphomicrobiales bacterium]